MHKKLNRIFKTNGILRFHEKQDQFAKYYIRFNVIWLSENTSNISGPKGILKTNFIRFQVDDVSDGKM